MGNRKKAPALSPTVLKKSANCSVPSSGSGLMKHVEPTIYSTQPLFVLGRRLTKNCWFRSSRLRRSCLIERPVNASGTMSEASRLEVRAWLQSSLARLWRYALVLSKARDAADDLVQATFLRAIQCADHLLPEHALTGGCSQFFARSGLTRCDRDEFVKGAVSSTRRMR
jgi:Sigma-70 region 2